MLKKPSTEKGDRSFGKATLGSPRMGFHHVHLLKRPLLPQCLVNELEPRRFSPCCARCNRILLPHGFPRRMNLTQYPILQTPEVPRHRSQCQRRVHRRSPIPSHRLKRRHHRLHLVTVVPVSSIHLIEKLDKIKQNNYFEIS